MLNIAYAENTKKYRSYQKLLYASSSFCIKVHIKYIKIEL